MIFSVIIALTPLLFNFMSFVTIGRSVSVTEVLYRGELLLISTAIAADATGRLVGSGNEWVFPKLLGVGAAVCDLMISAWWFGNISTAISSGAEVDKSVITYGSLVLFTITVIAGLSCLIIKELE